MYSRSQVSFKLFLIVSPLRLGAIVHKVTVAGSKMRKTALFRAKSGQGEGGALAAKTRTA